MEKPSIGWYKLAVAMKPRPSSSDVRNADGHGESTHEITMIRGKGAPLDPPPRPTRTGSKQKMQAELDLAEARSCFNRETIVVSKNASVMSLKPKKHISCPVYTTSSPKLRRTRRIV